MRTFVTIVAALANLMALALSSPALITSNQKLGLRQVSQNDASFLGYATVGSTC